MLKFQVLTDNLPCLNYVYLSGFLSALHVMVIVNIRKHPQGHQGCSDNHLKASSKINSKGLLRER